MSECDKQALKNAVNPQGRQRIAQEWADEIVLDAVKFSETPSDFQLRMRLFTWLLVTDKLELRIAIPEHIESPGPFHEKIGVFSFPWGDTIAFTGSANESMMGVYRKNLI